MFTKSPWIVLAVGVAACGDPAPPAPDVSVEVAGPYPVGTTRFVVEDTARGRTLPAQRWYPATEDARPEAEAGFAVEAFEDEPNLTAYADLLAAAPAGCPSTQAHAAVDATAADGAFPLVLFSHCHECVRFSSFTVAERLASHGFVVIAVEHVDNALWDYLDDTGVPLDADFLPTRTADVRAALDAYLDGGAAPPAIGVMGHSFGSVTAGAVAQEDERVDAALGIAAPMDNPLIAGVSIEELAVPLGFLVAMEDNSITELGNTFIRDNFAMAGVPAWKAEVADAGHWSFSDMVAIAEPFVPGCGDAERQTNGDPFTYLPAADGRAVAAAWATAFFKATLLDDAGAEAYLTADRGVTSEHHD
jgi:dienelactone hydrolase